jgi:hypothetical protein
LGASNPYNGAADERKGTMIVHKTFTEPTVGFTAQTVLAKQEKLREKAQAFVANELNDEDVVNITETVMTTLRLFSVVGFFSVTVWYKA